MQGSGITLTKMMKTSPWTASGHTLSLTYFLVCFLALCFPALTKAQEQIPAPPAKVTVKEALGDEYHGERVDITGVVLRQVGSETILLHDGTAAIEVDIPPSQIPPDGLKPNTRIRIKGEVTQEDNSAHEVEANQIFLDFLENHCRLLKKSHLPR